MATKPTFSKEVSNLLHAAHGNPINTCIQCGTCSATCPVVEYMDQTPRRIIGMIEANLKDEVLNTNTFWYCASVVSGPIICPGLIAWIAWESAATKYALKRYSMWNNQYQEDLIGPVFSETFVKTIVKSGRSYEPVLASSYLFTYGVREILQESRKHRVVISETRRANRLLWRVEY